MLHKSYKSMTRGEFAPKDAETIRSEVLEDLGIEYEGNEAQVDKVVERRLKDEEFKKSLHDDKTKHLEGKNKYKEMLSKAGFDPETGEKLGSKEPESEKKTLSAKEQVLEARALNDVHEDDIEEVVEYAERKGISLVVAKKSPYIKAFLKTREEERKTADAANTESSARTKPVKTDFQAKIKNYKLEDDEMASAAKAFVQKMKEERKQGQR